MGFDVKPLPGTRFTIADERELRQVAGWCRDGCGLWVWKNVNLSWPAGDILTPAGVGQAPRWTHVGRPEDITPDRIEVQHRVYLELPPEWYPACGRCDGTGKRSIASLADIRHETAEELMAWIELNPDRWHWGPIQDGHFLCNYCRGSGRTVEQLTMQATDKGWFGVKISQKGERAADALCARLKEYYKLDRGVAWDYQWIERRKVQAKFYSVWTELLSDYLARTYEGLIDDRSGGGGDEVLRETLQSEDDA